MSKFKITYDVPRPDGGRARGHGAFVGLMSALGEMKPGGSIFIERPQHVSANNFGSGAHRTIWYFRTKRNPSAKFSIRTVEEDGKNGIRLFRLEDRPSE